MKFNKNILIIAYACESDKGSEPAVGWNWTLMLSKIFSNVYVVTRKNNVDSIKKGLIKENIRNVEIIPYDLPEGIKKFKKKFNITRIYYYMWQIGAVKKISKMNLDLNVIQHVTFVNDYIPSMFYKLKSEKFIWGPIGSNERKPAIFINSHGERIRDKIKQISKYLQRKINVNFTKCVKRSDFIIGTKTNVEEILKIDSKKFIKIPAIGIEQSSVEAKIKHNNKNIILFVGNLVKIKNPSIALEGFCKYNLRNPKSEFWVLGEGKELNNMKNIINKYGMEDKIKFLGKTSREDAIKIMRESDIVIFPTLESAGFVTLESMSVGTPVISLNVGGPSEYLPKELLVDIDMYKNVDSITDEINRKIELILDNYNYFSNICIKKVKKYTWEEKLKLLEKLYIELFRGDINV